MNFLVDNQLLKALTRFLTESGHSSKHVFDLGMDEATDIEVWNYARQNGLVVVSKDEDFFHLANRPDDVGRLVWVRVGNCRKQVLLSVFDTSLSHTIKALESGYRIVEIR